MRIVAIVGWLSCFLFSAQAQSPADLSDKCNNNGTYISEKDICVCIDNYLGRYCDYPAYKLSKNPIPI